MSKENGNRAGATNPAEWNPMSKQSVAVNFVESLAAVLLGNAAYLLLSPYMPPLARHTVFKIDFGMLVDFWFCLVAFGVIKTARWWRNRKRVNSE
jgi:hypothetical protein